MNDPPTRKKTPGACERCREKRIKCNGFNPCDQCFRKGRSCSFNFLQATTTDAFSEKLDKILTRLDRIEQTVDRVEYRQLSTYAQERNKYIDGSRAQWVAQLNPQTGCLEYYGGTSILVTASSLSKRISRLEETTGVQPPKKKVRLENKTRDANLEMESLGLGGLTTYCDYVIPPHAFRDHRRLREEIADRHVENFFQTIHFLLPVFDINTFQNKYKNFRPLFGDNRLLLPTSEISGQQQYLCLLYAVLALGALYEDGREDSSSWASWYFAEAQAILGRLLDAANLELVQAAMLMGAYAQHVLQPNLAYNLTGIATRLGYSIGLNIESMYGSHSASAEEVKRTWWLVYVQEIELSLDSGRPTSLQISDMNMAYPTDPDSDTGTMSPATFIVCLGGIAKIMHKILNLVNCIGSQTVTSFDEVEALQTELDSWRASIPSHLCSVDLTNGGGNEMSESSLCSWQRRQRSSLLIHYNLAVMILHRNCRMESTETVNNAGAQLKRRSFERSCINAARDMILHIHESLEQTPSLRRWMYYCFYCIHASLCLLLKITDVDTQSLPSQDLDDQLHTLLEVDSKPNKTTTSDLRKLCELSIQVFKRIDLKASQRCAEVVRCVLDRWDNQKVERHDENTHQSRRGKLNKTKNGQQMQNPDSELLDACAPWISPRTEFPNTSYSELNELARGVETPSNMEMAPFSSFDIDKAVFGNPHGFENINADSQIWNLDFNNLSSSFTPI